MRTKQPAMKRTAEGTPLPLLREEAQRGQRFDIETTSGHEAITRLIIAQGEIQSRPINAVDLIPVIALAHENCLRADDHVALHVGWRSFKGGPVKEAAALEARAARSRLIVGRLFSFFFVVFVSLFILQLIGRRARHCPGSWRSRRLFFP